MFLSGSCSKVHGHSTRLAALYDLPDRVAIVQKQYTCAYYCTFYCSLRPRVRFLNTEVPEAHNPLE